MKTILRNIVISSVTIYLLSVNIRGMSFAQGINTVIITGAALALSFLIAKPIINILLLPLNLVTFGLFRWVSSILVFYLVTLLVSDFKINGFFFPGFSSGWFDLPQIAFSGVSAFIAFAFLYSLVFSVIHWLCK